MIGRSPPIVLSVPGCGLSRGGRCAIFWITEIFDKLVDFFCLVEEGEDLHCGAAFIAE